MKGHGKRQRKYTKEEMIKKLQAFHKKTGKIPCGKDVDNDPHMPSDSTYKVRFGSWNNALKAAGIEVGKKRSWGEKEIITAVQEFHKKKGRAPSKSDFFNSARLPSFTTATLRISSSWTPRARRS